MHANVGIDVIALGLADQRIERRPGVVPGPEQRLQPIDQGILVGAVQRIAGLEGDDAVPALGLKSLRTSLGESTYLPKRGCLGCGKTRIAAAQEVRLVGVALQDHVAAGMVGPIGEIDRLEVMGLVPRIDVADLERGHDLAGRVHQGHFLARLEPAANSAVTGRAIGIVQA